MRDQNFFFDCACNDLTAGQIKRVAAKITRVVRVQCCPEQYLKVKEIEHAEDRPNKQN